MKSVFSKILASPPLRRITDTIRQLSQEARRRETQGLPRVNWPSKTIRFLSHVSTRLERVHDLATLFRKMVEGVAEIQAEKGWKDGLRGGAAGRRCRNLSGRDGRRVMRRQSVI